MEAFSNLIVRKVPVNRNRSRQEALDATNRAQYTNRKVVDTMPEAEGDEAEVVFFKPDLRSRLGFISDDDLKKEFELRGLRPADPVSLAAVNEADPAFADDKFLGTYWKDAQGIWCYATFGRWTARERSVCVCRRVRQPSRSWLAQLLVVRGRSQVVLNTKPLRTPIQDL